MSQTSVRGYAPDESISALYARLDDLSAAAARGETAVSAFLTPREAKYARAALSHRLAAGTALLFGGPADAERVRAVLLPEYLEGLTDPVSLAADPCAALAAAGFDDVCGTLTSAVCAVRIRGSGYKTLSHRDYLGSILGAGLDRDAVGDIIVENDCTASVLCGSRIADFLTTNLERIGADAVRTERLPAGEYPRAERRTRPISDTVASERLDCVVAALCNLSRDKAQTLIRAGLCEMDYESVDACDARVEPPAVISCRGYGKFRVLPFEGETKKGRIRLRAEQYV